MNVVRYCGLWLLSRGSLKGMRLQRFSKSARADKIVGSSQVRKKQEVSKFQGRREDCKGCGRALRCVVAVEVLRRGFALVATSLWPLKIYEGCGRITESVAGALKRNLQVVQLQSFSLAEMVKFLQEPNVDVFMSHPSSTRICCKGYFGEAKKAKEDEK